MRPRITGISTAARPQQQPVQTFKPKSEWKHEEEASFLFVYLPGFAIEQLTITPDYSKRTVTVEGRRRLPNNRLLPVNETFSIPEDCELPKMDKQFGRGILMLKMPRNIVIPKQQITTKETKEEGSSKPQEPVAGDSMAIIKDEEQQTDIPAAKQTSTTGFEKQNPAIEEKSVMTTAAESDEEMLVEKKEENIINDIGSGKAGKEESPENLVQNVGVKEEESNKEQSKESAMAVGKAEEIKEKEKEKNPKSGNESADAKGKEDVKASCKKCMVKEATGDRKLIVNMGAAALIIMGIGVSLYYTIAHKLAS